MGMSNNVHLLDFIHTGTQQQLVAFACKVAKRASPGPAGLHAIEIAERWLRGEAISKEELIVAGDAASDADDDLAGYATIAAAFPGDAVEAAYITAIHALDDLDDHAQEAEVAQQVQDFLDILGGNPAKE